MNNNLDRLLALIKQEADLNDRIYKKSSFYYKNNQLLVLKDGLPFLKRLEPSPVKGKPKLCYKNCFQALWNYPELNYCEGFATSNEVPLAVSHAWLVNDDSEVVDPTWDEKYTGCTYFGVVFNKKFLREIALKTKHYGILDNDYLNEYQLLREEFPSGALHDKFHS